MHKIADIIPHVLNQKHQWKYQLLANWNSIFGPMNDKLYLDSIVGDTLILAVYDACWMHELHAMSHVLLDSINKTLAKPFVKQLRFKRAGIRGTKKIKKNKSATHNARKDFPLNIAEKKAIEHIKDPYLAAELRNFLMRCYYERELYENKKYPSDR